MCVYMCWFYLMEEGGLSWDNGADLCGGSAGLCLAGELIARAVVWRMLHAQFARGNASWI